MQAGGARLLAGVARGDRGRKLRALLAGESYFGHPYFLTRALLTPVQRARLLASDQAGGECAGVRDDYVLATVARARRYDPVTAVSYLEAKHYLVSTLLRDTDAMSMAHGIEVRVPFLDEPLLEHLVRLPGAVKLAGRGRSRCSRVPWRCCARACPPARRRPSRSRSAAGCSTSCSRPWRRRCDRCQRRSPSIWPAIRWPRCGTTSRAGAARGRARGRSTS
ncbi:MAG: asparagine synthase C-terminal domain-containing protein [Planctomycetota bacterium]